MTSLKPLLAMAADLAFPPRCPSCRASVSAQGNFCGDCFASLKQIADPQCDACGIPFAVPMDAGSQCPECLADPQHFDHVRAALVYDGVCAPLVRQLKFHDQYGGIGRYARMMQASLGALAARVDLLVPVPLHWRRLVLRRYNQSALLAFELARRMGQPCLPGALRRVRHTQPQMRLPRAQRLTNMRRAFAVPEGMQLHGKTVLLVDDVITTGATVSACAEALKNAGAAAVFAVALARTVKE